VIRYHPLDLAASRRREAKDEAAMKSTLQIGLAATLHHTVDEDRCIGFMGKEGMVYSTPRMVLDVEFACRDLLLQHLDDGEDSVGAHVSIDHLAATPLGLEVTIDVKIVEIDRRRVTFEFSVRDPIEECGRGRHVRFVADKAKSFERIRAKRAKAGL
jgi:fluoroacetyl-CoA thioesterase